MNGALMQDQWEAMEWAAIGISAFRHLPCTLHEAFSRGFVPVEPLNLCNAFNKVPMLELKEDE